LNEIAERRRRVGGVQRERRRVRGEGGSGRGREERGRIRRCNRIRSGPCGALGYWRHLLSEWK
jgi:hypothetical protein